MIIFLFYWIANQLYPFFGSPTALGTLGAGAGGWLRRAFVSYFAGPLEGSDSEAMEILIDSVHRFSVYPIVVLHGGIATPLQLAWSLRDFVDDLTWMVFIGIWWMLSIFVHVQEYPMVNWYIAMEHHEDHHFFIGQFTINGSFSIAMWVSQMVDGHFMKFLGSTCLNVKLKWKALEHQDFPAPDPSQHGRTSWFCGLQGQPSGSCSHQSLANSADIWTKDQQNMYCNTNS